MDESKTCSRCKRSLPRSEFHKRAASSDGLQFKCKACVLDQRREYRANNQEKVRAYNQEWRERNPLYSATTARKWREANPERQREYGRRWAAENADRLAEAKRAWYEANRERVRTLRPNYRESERLYRQRTREQRAEAQRVRRMVMDATPIPLPDLAALWTGRCGICAGEMARDLQWPEPLSPSIDHIIPISRGGLHLLGNLQWAHLRCNVSKGARMPESISA